MISIVQKTYTKILDTLKYIFKNYVHNNYAEGGLVS